MKKLFFIMFLAFPAVLGAQSYECEIFLLNGESLQGYAQWPDVKDTKVKFSITEGGKEQKLNSSVMDYIIFKTSDGDRKVKREKFFAGNGWFDVLAEGYMSLYMFTTVNKRKTIGGTDVTNESVDILCKREDESKAAKIYPTAYPWQNHGEAFAKRASEYFSDHPELAQKISNQEEGYQVQSLVEIVEEYNRWKMGQ